MDNLEKFINDNRSAFDDQEPSRNVWNEIEKNISTQQAVPKARRITLKTIVSIAASFLVVALVWNQFTESDDSSEPVSVNMDPEIESIDKNYAVQVRSFNDQIFEKQEELKSLVSNFPQLGDNLLTSLEHLDTSYDELKANLDDTMNQDLILEAMIENLTFQLSILNQQLELIKKIKHETNNEITI